MAGLKDHLPSVAGGSMGLNPALMCDPGAGGGERVLAIDDNDPISRTSCEGGGGTGGGPGLGIGDANDVG